MMFINVHDECFGDGSIPVETENLKLIANPGKYLFTIEEESFRRVISIDSEPRYDIKDEKWAISRKFIEKSSKN